MSLATRCTSCGTVFRVVQDQLKSSEGWVRCGRCAEVFNALEALYDLDREEERSASAGALESGPPALPAPAKVGPSGSSGQNAAVAQAALAAEQFPDPWPTQPLPSPPAPPPPQPLPHTDLRMLEAPAAKPGLDLDLDLSDPASPVESDAALSEPEGPDPFELHANPADVPDFVRRAERAALWRQPRWRAALGVAALGLLALLSGQWSLWQRDWLATRWPATEPALQAACNALGCQVEALRRIEQIRLDSTALVKVEGSSLYRLNLVLQNRGELPLMMPALDLALTDAQGQVTVRRVLRAADLGHAEPTLAAGSEISLQAMLSLGDLRINGYTVEAFYP